MQNSTTRTIDNLVKGFKGFSRPTDEMVERIAQIHLTEYPIVNIQEGPKKEHGKFCKRSWILTFPWKPSEEPSKFFTEKEANEAKEAYLVQNAASIRCRTSLLMDSLKAEARNEMWNLYQEKVSSQAEAVANVTRADALHDLSRM